MTRRRYTIRPRIRVVRDDDSTIVLGPGKADLLDAIARTGSIRAAAEQLGMSCEPDAPWGERPAPLSRDGGALRALERAVAALTPPGL